MRIPSLALSVIALSLILLSGSLAQVPFPAGMSGTVRLAYAASPTPIYLATSGLVYSDSLTTGDLHYWDMNGSAVVVGAPHSYQENASGLNLNLLAPSAGKWAGFYGVSPLTPAHLFHAKISLGQARPTSGLLDTAVYVQQQMVQDPRIDAMGCGADIYPNLTHWTISLQAGDQWHEIVPQTVYTDNSANQPTSRECTLVTDGNTTLTAYIDNQKVFSSNKMNLNMPEPLQYYVELQTNSVTPTQGSNFTGTFSDYYATSSDAVTVLNAQQGSIVKVVDASSGAVLASSIADSNNQAKMNVGMYHMPINANVQVFDSSGSSLLASTASPVGMYGGDVYNVGSPNVRHPLIHIASHDTSTHKNFAGVYTNISSSSGSFIDYTPFSFTANPFQPYIISITDDNLHTFVHWEDNIHTIVRVLTPTTADQNLTAFYSTDQMPPPPSSLTSLTQYTTNVTTPSITGNGIPGFSVRLHDNALPIGSPVIVSSNGTWLITTPPLANGAHVITATQKNLTDTSSYSTSAASGPITMTVDTTLPSITMSGSFTLSDNASLTGTATDSIVGVKGVDIQIDNTAYLPATQLAIGDWSNWSFQSAKLLPGNHTITARVTNLAGGQAFASMTLNIPAPDPSITISSLDTSGTPIIGMWTVISQNASVVQTGFTPINYKTTPGRDYSVSVGDYGSNYFDHWHNAATGQDTTGRTVNLMSLSNPVQLQAIYRHTATPPGSSIAVNGIDLDNTAINGMQVTLTDLTHNNTLQTSFTPSNFVTTNGSSYVLTAADYGTNYFDHWHNVGTGQDTTTRSLAIVATNTATQLQAVYRHTPAGSGSSISISGTDLSGAATNGMYTTLTDQSSNSIQTGFTAVNYPTVNGDTYSVSASDYGSNYFDHWHNVGTGQDTITRSLALVASSGTTQLVVVYRHTAAGVGSSIVLSGSDLNGTAINGMYTTITDTSNNSTRSGFTTVSYSTSAGTTYIMTAADYGTNYFDHWHNVGTGQDTTTRSLAINATSAATQLIAVYRNTP